MFLFYFFKLYLQKKFSKPNIYVYIFILLLKVIALISFINMVFKILKFISKSDFFSFITLQEFRKLNANIACSFCAELFRYQ